MTSLVQIPSVQGLQNTPEEVKLGLTTLAIHAGNSRRAHAFLLENFPEVKWPKHEATLREWAHKKFPTEYAQICEDELPKRYAAIADQSEALALEYGRLEEEAMEHVRAAIPELSPRDIGGFIRNLATARAIHVDKASMVRGRPTEIREDKSFTELLRGLSQFAGIVKVNAEAIEGSAKEIEDAG